ncbi:MAG: polysaccharide biosynthesis protein [Deltaproteobacteria bacterium]|nr:polysaccharide biosynthesis protein [Deltaproteobacteria bacterium]
MRKRILHNVASNYAAMLLSLGVGLLLTPFVLARLGPTIYGLWALVGSIVSYGSLLDFAISAAIIKYVAEHRARGEHAAAREMVATAVAVYLVVGAIVAALTIAVAPAVASLIQVPPDQRATVARLVLLMGIGVALAIPCSTPTAVLRGLHRFDLAGLLIVVSTLVRATGIVAVLLLGGGVLGLAAVNIAVLVLMQAPSVWLIYRVAPELRFGVRDASITRLRRVLSFSSSLAVMNTAGHLQTKTDEIVIGALMPLRAVTPYAIAHRLSDLPQILTDQFMRVLLPIASELEAGVQRERLLRLYITATRLTLVAFLPLGAALTVLAAPILTLWVGAEYADYSYLVGLLTLASLIDTSQWPGGAVLQGMARHRPVAGLSVVAGVANLALSVILCRRLGLMGVAIGTLVPTAIISLGLLQPYVMRVVGASAQQMLREVYLPAFLPVPVMTLTLYGLRSAFDPASFAGVIAVAGVGTVTYVGAYLGMTAPADDREIIGRLLGTIFRLRGQRGEGAAREERLAAEPRRRTGAERGPT